MIFLKKRLYQLKIILTGILTGLCNGLFGAGGGMIVVPSMVHFLDMDEHDAHATAIAVILPLTIISSFIYVKSGIIDVNTTLKVTIGSITGAYIGSKLLNKLPINILRKLFGIFMIIAAIRMVI